MRDETLDGRKEKRMGAMGVMGMRNGGDDGD